MHVVMRLLVARAGVNHLLLDMHPRYRLGVAVARPLAKVDREMIRRLRESQEEIARLHRTQMSRAEHLATLGELAAGLAHEIRNPLAGIAGVIDIVGRDLPASSPARQVVKDVRQEVTQINRIISDLLETARPSRRRFAAPT